MNRLLLFFGLLSVIVATAFAAQTVKAQTTLPETQIERIRQNCVGSQTALRQLHVSDAGLRVNRGNLYANISEKLMAPLNSRITLERHESLKLTATALEYDRQLAIFRASYNDYYESMASRTLKIDCAEKPVEFYESVKSSREKRQKLHDDNSTLIALLRAYKTEFEDFVKEFEEGSV